MEMTIWAAASVVDAARSRGRLERQAAGADQHVGLARRERLALHAEAGEVEAAGGGAMNSMAQQAVPERHRTAN